MSIIAMDDLEHACWECNGKGEILSDSEVHEGKEMMSCPKCDGKGYIPTALGQTILGFVKRHL
ncbi:tryptophan RNA-binding attenuation protein [Aneurinibacillus migulanus]|uniref:tryptophan RNA-binding attenuation protein n=1 Tax=Aneurinibacillus migulanus TaxID=47500 RepID=UPI0030B91A75